MITKKVETTLHLAQGQKLPGHRISLSPATPTAAVSPTTNKPLAI